MSNNNINIQFLRSKILQYNKNSDSYLFELCNSDIYTEDILFIIKSILKNNLESIGSFTTPIKKENALMILCNNSNHNEITVQIFKCLLFAESTVMSNINAHNYNGDNLLTLLNLN